MSILNLQKAQIARLLRLKINLFFPCLHFGDCYESIEFGSIWLMRLDMFNDVGLLAKIDKPTKATWHLRFAGDILRKNGSARTSGGANKDGILAKTVKGIVSFLRNFLPAQTQKEDVRPAQKSSRPWRHLSNRRHRHDLRPALRRPPTHALPIASINRRCSARRRHLGTARSLVRADCGWSNSGRYHHGSW